MLKKILAPLIATLFLSCPSPVERDPVSSKTEEFEKTETLVSYSDVGTFSEQIVDLSAYGFQSIDEINFRTTATESSATEDIDASVWVSLTAMDGDYDGYKDNPTSGVEINTIQFPVANTTGTSTRETTTALNGATSNDRFYLAFMTNEEISTGSIAFTVEIEIKGE